MKKIYKIVVIALMSISFISAGAIATNNQIKGEELAPADRIVGTLTELEDAIYDAPTTREFIIELSADIELDSTLTIYANENVVLRSTSGQTYTITHAGTGRHFNTRGTLTLNNVILDGGSTVGGVMVDGSSGKLVLNTGSIIQNCYSTVFSFGVGGGGAIYAKSGTVIMNDGIIQNNEHESYGGGGIRVESNGSFTMNGGIIRNNVGSRGGGINIGRGTFIMNDGHIYGNIGEYRGGGIYTEESTFTMNGGLIGGTDISYANHSDIGGGGVYAGEGSTFTMGGTSEVAYNTAGTSSINGGGAGVYTYTISSKINNFVMKDSATVHHNTATSSAGGVYIAGNESGTFTMEGNASIYNNQANSGAGLSIVDAATILKDNSSILNNAASGTGGGGYISNYNTFVMQDNAVVKGNTAATAGGLYISQGVTATIKGNSLITENTASYNGGGVYVIGIDAYAGYTKVYIEGGTISKNYANGVDSGDLKSGGGGIYYTATFCDLEITGDTNIIDNHAPNGHGGGIHSRDHSQIKVSGDTVYDGNTASIAYIPDPLDTAQYPDVQHKTLSIPVEHSLNNYDVNYVGTQEAIVYKVTYHVNGGVGTPPVTKSYLENDTVTVEGNSTNLTLADHTFDGWNLQPNGSSTNYDGGETFPMPARNIDLYAQWEPDPIPVTSYTITKTSNPGTGTEVERGDTITYSIAVKNTGDTVLQNVKVSDVLDAGVVYEENSITASKATVTKTNNNGTLEWVIDEVAKNETITLTFKVKVSDTATITNDTIKNTAKMEVGSDSKNSNEVKHTVKKEDPVTPTTSYTIKKSSNPVSGSEVKRGDTLTYSIEVKNTGDTVLKNVDVTDILDAGVVFEENSMTSSKAGVSMSNTNSVLTWKINEVAKGETITLTFKVKVSETATISTNKVTNIAQMEVNGKITNSNEVIHTVKKDGTVTPPIVNPPVIDDTTSYTITKISNPGSGTQVKRGDYITYFIEVKNTGDTTLKNVVISDTLTSGMELDTSSMYASDPTAGKVSNNGKLEWTIDKIEKDKSVVVSFRVRVSQIAKFDNNKIRNVAQVSIGNKTINSNEVTHIVVEKHAGLAPGTTGNNANSASVVNTGDNTNITLLLVMLGMSATLVFTAIRRKKAE